MWIIWAPLIFHVTSGNTCYFGAKKPCWESELSGSLWFIKNGHRSRLSVPKNSFFCLHSAKQGRSYVPPTHQDATSMSCRGCKVLGQKSLSCNDNWLLLQKNSFCKLRCHICNFSMNYIKFLSFITHRTHIKPLLWGIQMQPVSLQAHLIISCWADTAFFQKLKFCGNPVSSKSFGTIFSTSLLYFMSLCHIVIIFVIFQTFKLSLYLLWWAMISNLWCHYFHCLRCHKLAHIRQQT